MRNINFINPASPIGDTLPDINETYLNLELNAIDLKNQVEQIWDPMVYYYLNAKELFFGTSAYTTILTDLQKATTLVETNSAFWLKPITFIYPTLFSQTETKIQDLLLVWLAENFPVVTEGVDKPNYVEGQKAMVFANRYTYGENINTSNVATDTTLCITKDEAVCAGCRTYLTGHTYCGSNSEFVCSDEYFCNTNCKAMKCDFSNPPYIFSYREESEVYYGNYDGSGYKPHHNYRTVARASITAHINARWLDRQETDSIVGIIYKVSDCDWVFDSYVTNNIIVY